MKMKYIGIITILVVTGSMLFITSAAIQKDDAPTKTCVPTLPDNAINRDRIYVTMGNAAITAEIATTSEESELGLGQRDTLDEHAGMVFIMDPPRQAAFWMKGMRIPLDIIWVSKGKISGIERNVQPPLTPDEYPKTIVLSPGTVAYVIEVNGGWSDRNFVKVGEQVVFCDEL